MRITAVSLKNVKSYEEATIRFPLGTIAITGPNGAGKSTILEAIGFALFDYLPYRNQREFMRHNATETDVRVTFLSRLDECEYQAVRTLRRATGSADTVTSSYYVYSFDTQQRVAQQKQDVHAFLRRHIGLDDYDDLGRVFADVLGVPQGRLTADFLLTPRQRKQTFDPLLRVDVYRRVYEALRDVLDALQGKVSEHERRVSGLEPEAARLPGARAALAQYEAEHATSTAAARALATELTRLQDEQQRLESQRRTLEQQRALVRQQAQQRQNLQERLQAERAQVAAAMQAEAQVESAAAGHQAYQRAQEALAALEVERNAARQLRDEQHAAETALAALRTREAALEMSVAEAEAARAQRVALAPRVARQERLEAHAQEFHQDLAYARQAGRLVADMLRQVAEAGRNGAPGQAEVDLPAAPSEAAAFVCAQLDAQRERLQPVGVWLEQRADLRDRFSKTQPARNRTADDVAHCKSFAETASQLAGLEAQAQEFRDRVSTYEAERRFSRSSRDMAAGGLCPFFKDDCPKVEDGNSLTAILEGLIHDYTKQAEQARAERKRLEQAVAQARAAQKQVDRLADLRPRLRQLETELQAIERQGERYAERIDERVSGVWSAAAITETLAQLAAAEERLQQELRELGNPRQESDRMFGPAREYEQRAQALAKLRRERAASEAKVESLAARLAPYADLEQRVAAQRQAAKASRHDYQTYLRYQETAADLPRRQEVVAALTKDVTESAQAHVESQRLLAECEAAWEPAALADANANVSRTQGQLGAAHERSRHLSEQIAQAKQEIAALEAAARTLAEAQQALTEAREAHAVTGFLRTVIRDAGPQVARYLIQQVSAEANTLFSEIMGDASAELALTEDYDILLEQHGHRRGFMQLSGGEQMSAALAVRLGLLRQISDLDIAFFDEPTQNMDSERRHNLAEQLQRVKGFRQLFVISHDDTFEPMVARVLRVRKENGVSTVEAV